MRKLLSLIIFITPIILSAQTDSTNTSGGSDAEDTLVFKIMEASAYFPGGDAEMYRFINKNMQYPREAIENNIQGKVIVSFTVETDGTLTDIKILKDIGSGCGAEVVRILKLMPAWRPAIQAGNPVKTSMTIPVKFKLAD